MSLQAIVCRWVHACQQNCLLLWQLFVYAVLQHVEKLVHGKEESVLLPYNASKLSLSSGNHPRALFKGAVEWSSKQLLFEVPRLKALHMTWTSRYLFIASFNSYFDKALGYLLYSFLMHYRAVGHSLYYVLLLPRSATTCNYCMYYIMQLLYVLQSV